jgi:15-cis-phytoene synthase
LREWDRPRYLALLLMPQDLREDILALYAFNAELERIPLVVSEPQIGEIRFQWWLDTLDAMEQGATQDHPVADAFKRAAQRHALPYSALRTMAEARTRLLYADRPESIEELEAYFGNTTSALIQLCALVLGGDAATAAGLAGVAQGMAAMLAEPKRYANLMPKDWSPADCAAHGMKRLQQARSSTVASNLFPAFLPVALVEAQIQKGNTTLAPLRTQWLLWRASRTKRF